MKAGRYYVSALIEVPTPKVDGNFSDGIGIDLGLKNFAVVSNGTVYRNINKTARIRKLEKTINTGTAKAFPQNIENLRKGEFNSKSKYTKAKA